MKILKLKIQGMTCRNCAITIENLIASLKGISSVKINEQNHSGFVEFDPNAISEKEIMNTIHEQTSYRVIESSIEEPDRTPRISSNVNSKINTFDYEVIIIGGGSAAFSSAIQANEYGLRTLMINDGLPIGGTCVNVGCIPSKYLIRTAEYIQKHFETSHFPIFEFSLPNKKINFESIIHRKRELVLSLRKKKYINILKELPYVEFKEGYANFIDEHTISISKYNTITGKYIIIATGASATIPPIEGIKNVSYYTNENLFELNKLPEHLLIIGGGYIGLEIAQAYRRFGSKITLIEYEDRVIPSLSRELGNFITEHLSKEGIEIYTNTKIQKIHKDENNNIILIGEQNSHRIEIKGSHLFLGTGRKPNTHTLNLKEVHVETLPTGHIIVNEYLQTSNPHIFAIGDCNSYPAFVYTAAYEGNIAIHNIQACCKEEQKRIDYSSLPWVIFTDPQIAGCGYTKQELENQNIPYEESVLPIEEIPRFAVSFQSEGWIRLFRDPDQDLLLGAEIIAPEAGELITLLSFIKKYKIPLKDFSENLFPYLTASEGLKLASLGFRKNIHQLSCCAF